MSEKLLEISGLSVCYEGEQILNNICFSVEKGETVGIAGESGSGKSTLLRAILRLMGKNGSITGGQITFRGEELTGMSEKKLRSLCGSEIGMIFQNTGASLCPTRKIGAQICESVRAHEKRCGFITPISGGMSGRKSRREIKDMTLQRFADMGLSDGETIWNSYPSSLSGGMNQRVGIALAMLLHPSLLLADEPTSALDVVSQAQVLRELQALQQKEQTGMVLVTHNLAVLEQMADRVAVLKDGNIVEQGETRTGFDHPKDEYTKNSLRLCREEGRTMHNHNMLEVNNLSKNFAGTGRETEFAAVDGISFTLDAGECLGLIGESGCGKSTTARLITGLVQADAGSVLLEGEEILGRKGRRQREVYRKIQMVFQIPQDSFDPMQTLETGILEAFRNQGMSRKEACLHLPELLKKVELSSETAMRYPRETSGGECQRAAIARALAVQPSLLICDEATSALDAAVQAQIVQLLKKLQREEGLAMLWIGHDLALVRELCSRVIVMRQGKIVEQGETREVLEYPKEEYTKLLMEYSL